MKIHFDHPSFSFQTLRALGYAAYGGSSLGEVLAAVESIPEGDENAWYANWRGLAERVHAIGDRCAASGHAVSAREAYLRASNYYRTSEFFLRENPSADPRVRETSRLSVSTFTSAAALLTPAVQRVRIPGDGVDLPGWWIPADPRSGDPADRRPVLLVHGGFDSTGEELYFAAGAAASRRGYHVLAFEGPGQGSVLREMGLPFRPDWEVVVTAAVDYLTAREDVDASRIALMGMSLGGLLAPRAASAEHRLAALIAFGGVYSLGEMGAVAVGDAVTRLALDGADNEVSALLEPAIAANLQVRWTIRHGMWAFGADSPAALIRSLNDYSLADRAGLIRCPTLVLDGENDWMAPGQAPQLFDALTCPKTYHLFPAADGTGEHCQAGALDPLHQVVFDWLDDVTS